MSLYGGMPGFGAIATVPIADDFFQISSSIVDSTVYRLATASADKRVASVTAQSRVAIAGDTNLATDS